MMLYVIFGAAALQAVFIGVQMHPERPALLDPAQAREMFRIAEENRTADGMLTHEEVADILSAFDLDGDGQVTGPEFTSHWLAKELGDELSAGFLFSRADTNMDGVVTMMPDMDRLFSYFDMDGDGFVSEPEFVIVWHNLSS